jgi:hypothetical protein
MAIAQCLQEIAGAVSLIRLLISPSIHWANMTRVSQNVCDHSVGAKHLQQVTLLYAHFVRQMLCLYSLSGVVIIAETHQTVNARQKSPARCHAGGKAMHETKSQRDASSLTSLILRFSPVGPG